MLASHYVEIRLLHISCVAISGTLLAFRGALRIGNVELAHHRSLRMLSYVVDTTLLAAAILLTLIIHQYPFANAWLTTKVLLLVPYIALGMIALKRAQTPAGRTSALLAALVVFVYIIGVAIAHHPAGWFLLLHR
ncbi:MAG TPA: SirB2 family protein [Steroidobacteraceae bacterium]|nr:SirB2 family protein [Steroidobacteraceae bacterium]